MTAYGKSSFYAGLKLDVNPKTKSMFIKDIEKIIRTSLEYRNFIKFLKIEALLNYCTILNKLPDEIISKITIEMHHYPFTLYDLVEAVLNKHISDDLDYTRLSIANEVMEQHYFLKVGIVPLTKTMHELAHSKTIFVSTKNVFGNYKQFLNQYKYYIDNDKILTIEHLETITDETIAKYNKNTLEINPKLFIEEDDREDSSDEFD